MEDQVTSGTVAKPSRFEEGWIRGMARRKSDIVMWRAESSEGVRREGKWERKVWIREGFWAVEAGMRAVEVDLEGVEGGSTSIASSEEGRVGMGSREAAVSTGRGLSSSKIR